MKLYELKERVLAGIPDISEDRPGISRELSLCREDALSLLDADLEALCAAANEIRQQFCGNQFDLCSIINGKSGRCSEDCKFCAQSARYPTAADAYSMLDSREISKQAENNFSQGVPRFSIVTSGKRLTSQELHQVCECYQEISNQCNVSKCASHGLLSYEQLTALREAGVTRYHCNLETSRRYFPSICTTHTYEEKLSTLENARKAGLSLCSGGILGLGETMEDRIDMALELRHLGVRSVPINLLNPIPGTPFSNQSVLSPQELLRTLAIFRFLLPTATLRLAGGRGLLPDRGRRAFLSGANGAITGDMLTTGGITIETDLELIKELGYEAKG